MIARYCECGRSLAKDEWPGDDYVCSGCKNLPKACGCAPLAPSGNLAGIAGQYQPVDWREAFKRQPAEPDWVFGTFLERGTVTALFGRPGAGKSLVTLEIAVTVVRDGGTVVYLDDENRVTDLVDRLTAFGCHADELDRLKLFSFAGLPPLDTPQGGLHLGALTTVSRADLLILDTTTRMVKGKENDADTFLQLYRCSLAPLKGEGVTILRLDHPGKNEELGQRGSSAKDGDVDKVWKLSAVTPLTWRLDRLKSRQHHGPEAFELRRRFEPLRHDWLESVPGQVADGGRTVWTIGEIIEWLDGHGVPGQASRDQVRVALRQSDEIKASNAQLGSVVKIRKARGERSLPRSPVRRPDADRSRTDDVALPFSRPVRPAPKVREGRTGRRTALPQPRSTGLS